MNTEDKKLIARIKKEFPFQLDDKQARAILDERRQLDHEQTIIMDMWDVTGKIPTPEDFYGKGPIRSEYHNLPNLFWRIQEDRPNNRPNSISDTYDLGNW